MTVFASSQDGGAPPAEDVARDVTSPVESERDPQRAPDGVSPVVAADGDDEGECEWCSEVGQLWVIGVAVETLNGHATEEDVWLCNRCAEGYLTAKEREAGA